MCPVSRLGTKLIEQFPQRFAELEKRIGVLIGWERLQFTLRFPNQLFACVNGCLQCTVGGIHFQQLRDRA